MQLGIDGLRTCQGLHALGGANVWIITEIDKDNRHAFIIQENGTKNQESVRVRWEELVPIGDRICTPIYSPTDIIKPSLEIPTKICSKK